MNTIKMRHMAHTYPKEGLIPGKSFQYLRLFTQERQKKSSFAVRTNVFV